MKRAFIAFAALSALVTGAIAQKPMVPPAAKGPKTIKCAVMTGSSVNIASAMKKKMYSDYKGRRYFFCCDGCPQAFKANPAKFAKNASIPVPKKK